MDDPKTYFRQVDDVRKGILGRDYKKGYVKGNLVKECEDQIIKWANEDSESFKALFLGFWVSSFLNFYMSDIYQVVYKHTLNSQTADVYSDGFIGKCYRENLTQL